MRKGYTLAVVMTLFAIISAIAIMSYDTAKTQEKIVQNDRLYKQARLNAQSGITHFLASHHHYDDLIEIGQGQEEFLLIEGELTTKDHYRVHVKIMDDERFEVTSHGVVTNRGKAISAASLKATFKSEWIKRNRGNNE